MSSIPKIIFLPILIILHVFFVDELFASDDDLSSIDLGVPARLFEEDSSQVIPNEMAPFSNPHIYLLNELSEEPMTAVERQLTKSHIRVKSLESFEPGFEGEEASTVRKQYYMIDNFFSSDLLEKMYKDAEELNLPNKVYSTRESMDQGEEPTYSMKKEDSKEFWKFPNSYIHSLQELLAFIAQKTGTVISTQPDVCTGPGVCANSFPTNAVKESTKANSNMSIHRDYRTTEGLGYQIQHLYDDEYYPDRFVNGATDQPYLITVILYISTKDFNSKGLGTRLFPSNKNYQISSEDAVAPKHGRILIFDGTIDHTIQDGFSKHGRRISLVYKLIARKKTAKNRTSIAKRFSHLFFRYSLLGYDVLSRPSYF